MNKFDRLLERGPMALLCAIAALGMSFFIAATAARAETLVVVEARGVASTAGDNIDSGKHLTLRSGEHVRLIGENGNQYCLDGPYDGPARPENHGARARAWYAPLLYGPGEENQADPLTDCMR